MPEPKPLVFRAPARADVEAALGWFLEEAGEQIATRFTNELEAAYTHITSNPNTGSPRWGHTLDIPGLRHWPLKHFPYLVFFIQQHDRIEIVHILHSARAIPSTLGEPEAD
ncbi:MAG: type II toxin-antitoxin system RelE/ParE family toxin [Burkholderiaceae bacterium]